MFNQIICLDASVQHVKIPCFFDQGFSQCSSANFKDNLLFVKNIVKESSQIPKKIYISVSFVGKLDHYLGSFSTLTFTGFGPSFCQKSLFPKKHVESFTDNSLLPKISANFFYFNTLSRSVKVKTRTKSRKILILLGFFKAKI